MLYEITQIKEWLRDNIGLRSDGTGGNLRIIDPVPPGTYEIPIGYNPELFYVTISDDPDPTKRTIRIGDRVPVSPVPTGDQAPWEMQPWI